MFKCIVTLIFTNFMVAIYTQPPVTLTNSIITNTEQAEVVLAEIEAKEALPVVLFEITINQFSPPDNIDQVVTVSGKMIKGTTFSLEGSQEQIFYCPKPNSTFVCLFPQEFKDAELLQCTEEPTPVVLEKERRCGFEDVGIPCLLVYEICEDREGHIYKKSSSIIYGFCFNKKKGKTIYATHHILAPKLLESKLLLREQQVRYKFSKNDLYNTANAEDIENSLDSESRRDVIPSRRFYQVQKLVPNEDMALANWGQTTFQYVNAELQHYRLFHIWNKMNKNVREKAIQMDNDGIKFNIKTGTFDIFPKIFADIYGDPDQIYNIWIKLIVSQSRTSEPQGVAILMNNFLNVSSPFPQTLLLQNKIEGYCPDNLCANDFIDQFTKITGMARCCHITEEIIQLFGLPFIDMPLLHIPGVV